MSSKSASKRRTTRKAAAEKKTVRPAATHVKLFNAMLDEDPKTGEIILRGSLDSNTLEAVHFDDYQREVLSPSNIEQIKEGFKEGGSIPDVDLGMRGAKTKDEGTDYVLLSQVYGIDGKQRISAGIQFRDEGGVPRLGATVHFNTNKAWEIERFRILNSMRTKVSSNVLLRNMKDKLSVIDLILKLSEDSTFILKGRIQWQNNKQRNQLISARTLAVALLTLRIVGNTD